RQQLAPLTRRGAGEQLLIALPSKLCLARPLILRQSRAFEVTRMNSSSQSLRPNGIQKSGQPIASPRDSLTDNLHTLLAIRGSRLAAIGNTFVRDVFSELKTFVGPRLKIRRLIQVQGGVGGRITSRRAAAGIRVSAGGLKFAPVGGNVVSPPSQQLCRLVVFGLPFAPVILIETRL